jgi:hypothetical protein
MLRWLADYLGLGDAFAAAKRRARLSEDEALAIARTAGEGVSDAVSLRFTAIADEGTELVWTFSTPSRGSVWSVKIRDCDGQVVERRRGGLR